LFLGDGEILAPAFRFGLDNSNGAPVGKQDIIGGARVRGVFAGGDAVPGVEIEFVLVLPPPARRPQPTVDLVAGDLFRILIGVLRQWTRPGKFLSGVLMNLAFSISPASGRPQTWLDILQCQPLRVKLSKTLRREQIKCPVIQWSFLRR